MPRLTLVLALFFLGGSASRGCTIFILTDERHTLFFNNEDWSNSASRLWFVPAGADHLGCAYVGFDDGWAQGGVNTAGVAFDWVAGAMERYVPDASLARVRGNSSQRMLEQCTTVDEAIAFYRTHRETEFARAHILIADRSGASVIIGAKDGALSIDRRENSRGFGYGWRTLQERLAVPPAPTLANGAEILRACIQKGVTPTQYSNGFDLRSGEIFIYPAATRDEPVRFDLRAELAQGGHSYDVPRLTTAAPPVPQPLSNAQKRFYLDEWSPLKTAEPDVVARISNTLRAAAESELNADDFTPELWKQLAPAKKEMQTQIKQLGPLQRVTLVAREQSANGTVYRCISDFSAARILQRFEISPEGKIAAIASEYVELQRP